MVDTSESTKSLPERVKEKVNDTAENVASTLKAKKQKAPKKSKEGQEPKSTPPKKEKASSSNDGPIDPDAMFKEGWLKAVYQEKPSEQVFSRFPPEPNGFLHIGHSKAIAVNFGFARYHGGKCYLRYDDTNPEAEDEIFFTSIKEIIEWLGFEPYKITYSSDNFDRLYELAEQLIQDGGAYVCHCPDEEVKLQRGGPTHGERYACPHRSRPVEESLTEFRAMRDGKYKPKEAWLRMKQDITNPNPEMWDLAAYRILEKPHYRTGRKWRIYPTYSYTHPLCDSIENITHSLCTVEFFQARESYEWLCDMVKVYKPMQRE